MNQKNNIPVLIEKYRNGDSLSDKDLADLLEFFEPLYEQSRLLPMDFNLFRIEIQKIYRHLESYREARKRNR